MKYSRYEKYKDSGIEWLGAVPHKWKFERLHNVAQIKTSNIDKKKVVGQDIIRLCNYIDVYYHDKITSEIKFMLASASKNEIERFHLKKGDVIITKDSESPFDIGIPTFINENIKDLVCGYHLSIIKSYNNCLIGSFLFYALKSLTSVYQFSISANGVTRFGLSYKNIKNIKIVIPSIHEQSKIAEFLDQKTTQIDTLIEKKKAFIEKLNEKRVALITKAVTKGLDDSVPMKDSGVDWLGEIPARWDIRRIKECSTTISKGTTPTTEGREIISVGPVRFFKAENISDGDIINEPQCFIDDETNNILKRSQLKDGDVLFVIAGATLGKTAIIQDSHLPANTNQAVSFIRPNTYLNSYYLKCWFQSSLFKELTWLYAVQSAQPNLSMGVLGNFIIPLPVVIEQHTIVDYINLKTSKIYELIQKLTTAINRLNEYRTALITAAVTGKIKVA